MPSVSRWSRRSIRLPAYDYAEAGAYFVTICTRDRALLFDDSVLRTAAEECWSALPRHFAHVSLDEWVVMPNHVHGIICINVQEGEDSRRGVQLNAPTQPRNLEDRFSKMSPRAGTLGVVIRTDKAAVTRRAHRAGYQTFGWQRNYYERVIRDDAELDRVRRYVHENPLAWDRDEYHPAAKHTAAVRA